MVHTVSIGDEMQEVVGEALERTGQAEAETPCGLGIFDDLRCEFPHAMIMTINLTELIETVHGAVESPEA
jgi:hypothetical protein